MLIEVLYIPGCCNHGPAVERVRRALGSAEVNSGIAEISVNDEATARMLQFPGSPTVRVNGVDVESGANPSIALACRLYADRSGLPSEHAILQAIQAARKYERDHGTTFTK
jgi:hypothetical protein